jgi:anti-sigma regulatory factor (Ser/Thr protein kinase)
MSLIGVISSNEGVNDKIRASFASVPAGRWFLQFPKDESEVLEFLNFDLPEIVVVNFSDKVLDVSRIVDEVREDTWLHNFGIVGLFDSERQREESLLDKLKNVNVLALIDYERVSSHIVKLTQIIEDNRQIIFQRELTDRLVEHSSGSFTIDNDPLAVSIYAGIAATTVAQRGLIDSDSKMHLQLALSELIINAVEHGNCGITFDEKSAFLDRGLSVVELVAEKCKDSVIAAKKVSFEWDIQPDSSRFVIRDEGEGFDVKALSEKIKKEGEYSLHGRGIMMARGIAAKLAYNAKGNEVTLTIKHNTALERTTPRGFGDSEVVSTEKGDIIFREGESSDFLYYIASGEYSVFHKTRHVGMLRTADIFMGEMSFLLNNRRSATVRAETAGKLIKISRRDFVSVIKQFPHYGIFLSKLLARKLARANSRSAAIQRADAVRKTSSAASARPAS